MIIANITGDDYIMLQITSKNTKDNYSISLSQTDFCYGSLNQESNIRPNKIFTLDQKLILYKIGHLTNIKLEECITKVFSILKT